jgi:hypothetical protein
MSTDDLYAGLIEKHESEVVREVYCKDCLPLIMQRIEEED